MVQGNLPLRGIPAALNSEARHSEFSQATQELLRKLRAPPEQPDVLVMECEIHGRQSTEWLRESITQQAVDGARQAQYMEDIRVLAQATEGRQGPERPPLTPSKKQGRAPSFAAKDDAWQKRCNLPYILSLGFRASPENCTEDLAWRSVGGKWSCGFSAQMLLEALALVDADLLPAHRAAGGQAGFLKTVYADNLVFASVKVPNREGLVDLLEGVIRKGLEHLQVSTAGGVRVMCVTATPAPENMTLSSARRSAG